MNLDIGSIIQYQGEYSIVEYWNTREGCTDCALTDLCWRSSISPCRSFSKFGYRLFFKALSNGVII